MWQSLSPSVLPHNCFFIQQWTNNRQTALLAKRRWEIFPVVAALIMRDARRNSPAHMILLECTFHLRSIQREASKNFGNPLDFPKKASEHCNFFNNASKNHVLRETQASLHPTWTPLERGNTRHQSRVSLSCSILRARRRYKTLSAPLTEWTHLGPCRLLNIALRRDARKQEEEAGGIAFHILSTPWRELKEGINMHATGPQTRHGNQISKSK